MFSLICTKSSLGSTHAMKKAVRVCGTIMYTRAVEFFFNDTVMYVY